MVLFYRGTLPSAKLCPRGVSDKQQATPTRQFAEAAQADHPSHGQRPAKLNFRPHASLRKTRPVLAQILPQQRRKPGIAVRKMSGQVCACSCLHFGWRMILGQNAARHEAEPVPVRLMRNPRPKPYVPAKVSFVPVSDQKSPHTIQAQ